MRRTVPVHGDRPPRAGALAPLERSLLLDAIVAALAVAAVGAAVLFGAVVESTGGSPGVAAMNIAYPLADALLLDSSSRCWP